MVVTNNPKFRLNSKVRVLTYPTSVFEVIDVVRSQHDGRNSYTYKLNDDSKSLVMPQHMIRPYHFNLPKLADLGDFLIIVLQDAEVLPKQGDSHTFGVNDQEFAIFYKINDVYRLNLNYQALTITLTSREEECSYFSLPLPYDVSEVFKESFYAPFCQYVKTIVKHQLDAF